MRAPTSTGAALARHPDVAKIAFTGSTATGRSILQAGIPEFKRVTLELGGKSPSIIHRDADVEPALAQAAMSCFFNSGQVCYAGTRLYVHRSLYERVLEGIACVSIRRDEAFGLGSGKWIRGVGCLPRAEDSGDGPFVNTAIYRSLHRGN